MKQIIFNLQHFGEAVGITLNNDTPNTVITGTAYPDWIQNYSSQVTINSCDNPDRIDNYSGGNNVVINSGEGWDFVYNEFNENVNINGGEGNDTVENNGSNNVTINGEEGGDYILNRDTSYGVVMNGGEGYDVFYNDKGHNAVINGGDDSDIIQNQKSDNVTINGGDDEDNITNIESSNVLIIGGAGDDHILNMYAANTTINGGAGDDYIYNSGINNYSVYQYNNGDGNDVIYGFEDNDTLIIGGATYSTVINGVDLIVKVGEGTITLEEAARFESRLENIKIQGEIATEILNAENGVYTYSGGNRYIENYSQGEQINLASDYKGIEIYENTLYVKSSSGSLKIENARDKVISYGDANGNFIVHSCIVNRGGEIDYRGSTQAEMLIGGNNADNLIYAGNGNSSLWGGNGGADTLIGGEGYNEFFYAIGNGSDVIQNANAGDLINLASVSISQISGVEVNGGQVNINFADGGNLQVQGGNNLSYKLAEGTFTFNQSSTGEWSVKVNS